MCWWVISPFCDFCSFSRGGAIAQLNALSSLSWRVAHHAVNKVGGQTKIFDPPTIWPVGGGQNIAVISLSTGRQSENS